MALQEAMGRRGYTFRQHLEEAGWTARKPTVVDLTGSQAAAYAKGGTAALGEALAREGLWSFPAVDIQEPLPVLRWTVLDDRTLVVAPKSSDTLWAMAERSAREVKSRSGVELKVVDDTDQTYDLLKARSLILFGGGGESPLARDLAMRYQTFLLDATVPGEGGWAVTTHAGLDATGHSVVQVWADAGGAEEATACLLGALGRKGELAVLRRIHRIEHGPEMRAHFPSWQSFSKGLPGGLPEHVGGPEEGSEDPALLAAQVAKGLDSGGRDVNHYNAGPIDTANTAAYYYLLSGDERALQLFRELLWRIAEYYLKMPGGASYPADLDFRSGHLVLFWSRLEHEPVFSEEDRLILSNLLLAMTRSTHEYATKQWPVEPNGPTRHNHETFPARSLAYAADYFRRYGVPDVDNWQTYSEAVFSGGLWKRHKQKENANHYEQTAYEHASCYSGFTGRRLTLFDDGVLAKAAARHVAATDNFFRAVDYGDSSAGLGPSSADVVATLATCSGANSGLAWYAHEIFSRGQNYLGRLRGAIPGLRRADVGSPPVSRVWEPVQLEPRFIDEYCQGLPGRYALDKLAYRTGWAEDDQYLLLECVGNKDISHAHNEVNALVRYNHLGRHWVVSNGYGRRTGLTNVNDSFNTRVRGPEDHNTLVLRRGGEVVEDLPVCAAVLQRAETADYAVSTTVLAGYSGTDWFRTLVVAADRFLLVVDRVRVVADGLEGAHIEWNVLGDVAPTPTGCRLDQRGAGLDISSPSGWAVSYDASDRSADWERTLRGDAYPHADFPIKKVIYAMPVCEPGGEHCVATLLTAFRDAEDACRISQFEDGAYRVEGRAGSPGGSDCGAGHPAVGGA